MSKKYIFSVATFTLLIGFLLALGVPAQAQVAFPTPTVSVLSATPAPMPTPQVLSVSSSNLVSFAQLKQPALQLVGPFDSYRFSFGLPSDWKVTPGAELDLSISTFFTTVTGGAGNPSGGTLTFRFNANTIGVVPLNTVGDMVQKFIIAPSDFTSVNADGSMTLDVVLDSGANCTSTNNLSLIIRPTSYFVIPHNSAPPDTSLVNYPKPIYQSSFNPDSVLFILPDHPTSAELQAALTIAAGLGSQSGNSVKFDLTTVSNFKPGDPNSVQGSGNHLIIIDKPDSLSILNQFHWPLPIKGGQFQTGDATPDDGVIQMINSPWSVSHVILAVSGNTDQGIIKAAQALSTGVLRPNNYPNLSIVQVVNPTNVTIPQTIDQTLADLGMVGGLFAGRGDFGNSFRFTIPPGQSLAPDAYFDLDFANSALINYDRSTIVVYLNNRPIGSVRMSDATAAQAINQVRIAIPSAAVVPGNNQLQIKLSIVPIDNCTPPTSHGLWISIWPQSTLHLPLELATFNPVATTSLASFPAPFIYDPALSSTGFVLPHDDLDSWRGAVQIAAGLGAVTNNPVTELSVFYSEELTVPLRAKFNLLVIGEPTLTPFVNDINQFLPAPFSTGSNVAAENNFQVTYQIPLDSPMGYVEMIPSPWNSTNVVLAALGNNVQGVDWAVSALTDPVLQSRMSGNISVVNDSQIISTDTRVVKVTAGVSPTQLPNQNVTPLNGNTIAQSPAQSSNWIVPVMVAAIALIVVILIVMIAGNRVRNRIRPPRKDE